MAFAPRKPSASRQTPTVTQTNVRPAPYTRARTRPRPRAHPPPTHASTRTPIRHTKPHPRPAFGPGRLGGPESSGVSGRCRWGGSGRHVVGRGGWYPGTNMGSGSACRWYAGIHGLSRHGDGFLRHVVSLIGDGRTMMVRLGDMSSGRVAIIAGVDERRRRTRWQVRQVHCDGKEALPNVRVAKQVAARMNGPAQAYRCAFCHQWHVGSVERRPRGLRSRPAGEPSGRAEQRRRRQQGDDLGQ